VKSIRVFLIAALLSAVSLGIFLAVVQGYRAGTANAQALLDTQLADFAAILADPGRSRADDVVPQPSERLAFQIWTVDRELVQRTANTPADAIAPFEQAYREENFAGHRWRVLSHRDARNGLWVLVGERIDVRIGLADSVVLNSVLPIIVSLPVIAGIVWLVVGRGLSLVSGLADELGTKRADDLSRLRAAKPPRELAPVVDAINELLRRLEESVQRERRFSSDAAHELRTPISALKIHVHNLKKALPDQLPVLQSLDDDLGRLGHIIEQMLTLYRTSPEHYQAKMRKLDLYPLAQSVISELYEGIDRRGQSISLEGSHLEINGDDSSLRLLLSNLIQNASKYSPTGAEITVSLQEEEFGIALQVSDTGPGIPLAELSRVLDRFYRVGGDRHSSNSEGCGLGLSIARHIADLHHANLTLSNNDPGPGLTASVIFPYHTSDSHSGTGQ
jgi:two-component system sensor histidine kinase QseC